MEVSNLGRDLARTNVGDPTFRFIGIMAAFSAISIYAVTTKSFVGHALSLAAVFSFPLVTKRFFYDRRPDVVMNNFYPEGMKEQST